jgi:xylulokinase
MSLSYSLGIEFSTQSVKTVVLDLNDCTISFDDSFNYDQAFPEYKTRGGVLPSEFEEIRHTSPFMLIESIDLAFKRLSESGIDISLIKAIKCDGMQHCTVYVNSTFGETISSLDPKQYLMAQICNCISRPSSPIWEDRSTSKEAEYLTDALKNEGGILNITGNRAELRFPASQILKWASEHSHEYLNTSGILILSAFITSILAGKISAVDTGDGWGSNLNNLDINNPGWSDRVLKVIDQYLEKAGINSSISTRLGYIDHYDAEAGIINPYFTEKYGIAPETVILTGTGDNPATLLGCGCNIVVSLGSSYTVNGVMKRIVPSENGEYNVFGYTNGTAMALSVITNGGKVQDNFLREFVLRTEVRSPGFSDWQKFISLAGDPLLSHDEKLLLPYLLDESVPLRKKGIVRDNFPDHLAGVNVRALILSQVLSLKLHSNHLGEVKELCVVGGGARNSIMMQWIADAFGAVTYTIENPAFAAPLGCAISAAARTLNISYREAADRFVRQDPSSVKIPIHENIKTMHGLLKRYHDFENRVIL